MMGCGKSTVGKCLSKRAGLVHVDTDELIVERYGKIADIFAQYGEEHFRTLETQSVRELSGQDGLVISTGGGVAMRAENVSLLKEKGKIVFLRAKVETLEARLQADTQRPLLKSATPLRERLEELLQIRAPIYEDVADLAVDVDGQTPEEIAAKIIKGIGQV